MNPHSERLPDEIIVLIAEDDADDRDILCEVFEESDRNVVALFVHDGAQLLTHVRSLVMSNPVRYPDLIVLDVNMPRLNGIDALKMLKSNSDTKEIPVVILTTSKDPVLRERLLQLGACAFYSKPAQMEDFKKTVHEMLEECLELVPVTKRK